MRSPRRRVLPGTALLLHGWLVLLVCGAVPMSAKAQLVPPWRLKDEVGVISDAGRRDIIQRISVFELHTKRQFAVWIKADVPESEVDDLVASKFQQWALGDPDAQLGGLLLTVSVGDRSAYVAVNYDLDTIITNEISQRIVRETIEPALEQHAFEDAVDNGLIALMVQAAGHGPWEVAGTRHPIEDVEPANLSEAIVQGNVGIAGLSLKSRYVWPDFLFFALSACILMWAIAFLRGDVSQRRMRQLAWLAAATAALTLTAHQVLVSNDRHWQQWPASLLLAVVVLLLPSARLTIILFRALRGRIRQRAMRLWVSRAVALQLSAVVLTAIDCGVAGELRSWDRWPITWVLALQFAAVCLAVANESIVLLMPASVRRQFRFPMAWATGITALVLLSAAMLRLV